MGTTHLSLRRRTVVLTCLVVLAAVVGTALYAVSPGRLAGPPPEGDGQGTPPKITGGEEYEVEWSKVQQLISEQKLEGASKAVAEIRERARSEKQVDEWTRALIEEVQLRTALHGYETAVRFLMEQEWPDDAVSRAVLDLFYANSLVVYAQMYSWEIRQRERVESENEVDLKAWTLDRIAEEANRAFLRVYAERERWGEQSLGPLARYIDQNSYPARIRGTLCDAVCYMWVQLLADSSLWRPQQSNELFRLDLEALIKGDPKGSHSLALDDPAVHPMLKIGAVLDDLEAWHGRKRPEAALEARLERLRRLHDAFTQDDDRKAIRAHLEHRLESFDHSLDWWSMGQSVLAEMIRQEPEPDSQVRARAAALAGAERHPDSIGGQRCHYIVAAIEAPSYSISAMASDGPEQRSIRVEHSNLDRIHFRAFTIDLVHEVETARDYNLLPDYREVPNILDSRQPVASWSVDLPPTPDFRSHATDVVPPMTEPGAYLIVASARRDFSRSANHFESVHFLLTDLVLVRRQLDQSYEYTVVSGATGHPIEGVDLSLYRFDWQKGHHLVASQRSANDGRAVFESSGWRRQGHFVLARHGDHLALDTGSLYDYKRSPRGVTTAAFVYTDRSVYRPLQTVHWKAVAYRGGGDDFRFRTQPATQLAISLVDANGEQVASETVRTNSFGSASGAFDIPAGRLLGAWTVRASIGGATQIRVEEYKRPTFEVTISDPATPLRLNRDATLGGEVRYYFGLPVTDATFTWRVSREPVYPPWWYWWGWRPTVQTQIVASGEGEVDADGKLSISFKPEADEREAKKPGVTYRYRLSVEVTDAGGETRSAERAFRLGFVSVEAAISRSTTFGRSGEVQKVSIFRSDLNGSPRPGAGEWRLVALKQPATTLCPADQPLPAPPDGDTGAYRTEGDARRPRYAASYNPDTVLASWEAGREIAHGVTKHGDAGSAEVELPKLKAGAYRVIYTTKDDFGATFETTSSFVVAGAKSPVALPGLLLVERSSLKVGDTARILALSGFEDQDMVLEIYRDGRRRERRALSSGRSSSLIELPITMDDRGGLGLTLSLVRDHQLIHLSQTIYVPWDDRRLKVEFATFRDTLKPGSSETFRVTVRGVDGQAIDAKTAELLAYMYDKSLDIFAPHSPPSPTNLYPMLTNVIGVSATLGAAQKPWQWRNGWAELPYYPTLSTDQLKRIDGYGIGGPGARGGGHLRYKGEMMRTMAAVAPSPQEGAVLEESEADMETVADAVKSNELRSLGYAGEAKVEAAPEPEAELRSDFSETAFFQPHLLLDEDGSAAIELSVPDSVTEWNLWVHAITTDLRSGSVQRQLKTVKELMVRPYLPRFLREGDQAALRVVVNNAGEAAFDGTLDFEINDPDSEEDLRLAFDLDPVRATDVPFSVEAGKSATLEFPIKVPVRVGTVAFKVVARAGDFSDGELRALPVLPGRMHLMQSRFVTLRDEDRRELHFADMLEPDPTLINDQLVVTVDAQLFYSVLNALPYLVSYPYECTEQTLNRFLSTGIVSSVYADYPAVERMAKKLSQRETRLEKWEADDPNRKMALVETPWLVTSRGGGEDPDDLINVLDPKIARAQRDSALAKLKKSQTSIGAFPWWPGGPPSPYMTLYILYGFSKALELGVDVPRDTVVRAWAYMHQHYMDEIVQDMMRHDCCWELITFLNYALSSYPDDSWTGGVFTADDRQQMLDFSFRHWKRHSPLLKGYLALTLERAGRHDDGVLVFDSVMDSAKTEQDLGTYWAPEDRAWLWYNDTIETHAFALRTLTELEPSDDRRHGLVQWLLLNKKLNHWKSTRATAEVIYSMVHYLKHEGTLAIREDATVEVGPIIRTFVFEPDEYTGARNRVIVPGPEVDPKTMSTVVVSKEARGYAFASATWHFSTEKMPDEARGDLFGVTRALFRRVNKGDEWILEPLKDGAEITVGDQLEVQLSITARHAAEYVHLRDPRGAGFEPETLTSRYRWDLGIGCYEEIRDSGTNFFFEWLPAGEYTFKYRLRANMAGTFRVAPATLQSMYAPEFAAYSAGHIVRVAE
jgi:uncharacterized protein YfaS (alpha-2-macroglobulin family)